MRREERREERLAPVHVTGKSYLTRNSNYTNEAMNEGRARGVVARARGRGGLVNHEDKA